MPQYHVFFDKQNKVMCVDTTGLLRIEQIERRLKNIGWNGNNWYGTVAEDEIAAITEARKQVFTSYCDGNSPLFITNNEVLDINTIKLRLKINNMIYNPCAFFGM